MAAHPRAALRVPVALPVFRDSSGRCRKRVIAPPTESLRWPERQARPGQTPLGSFCWCRPLRSKRAASAVSLVPTACGRCDRSRQIRRSRSRRACAGTVQPVSANLPKESGANCRLCVPQTGALSWVQTFHLIGVHLAPGSMAGLSNPVLSVTHVLGNFAHASFVEPVRTNVEIERARAAFVLSGACRQLAERLRLREQKSENQTPCGVSGTVLVGSGCSRRILHRPVVSVSCCLKACGIRALS